MSGHGVAVVVLPAAADHRQQVGPFAWVVLEQLAALTDPRTPDTAITTSVRDIAARLSISKDTVTRAMLRLIEAGLVDRFVDRAATGQFGNAAYRVHLERAGLRVADDHGRVEDAPDYLQPTTNDSVATTPPRKVRRRPSTARLDPGQLSLLDGLSGSDQ